MRQALVVPPRQWKAVGNDLNSPVILGVSVVNAEVNDSGVSGHPGCFLGTGCTVVAAGVESATAPAATAGHGRRRRRRSSSL